MKMKNKEIVNGEIYHSVHEAARMLGTNIPKIKKLRTAGRLEWVF